jgi:hypothetical protein
MERHSFESPSLLFKVLTGKRWQLLQLMRSPVSRPPIFALAPEAIQAARRTKSTTIQAIGKFHIFSAFSKANTIMDISISSFSGLLEISIKQITAFCDNT